MVITDVKGKYKIEILESGTIVDETINNTYRGLWTDTDFRRMHADYIHKIYPLVKGKKWVKCCDVTNYKTSNIENEMAEHLKWAAKNGMQRGCLIIECQIAKMQIVTGAGGESSPICPVVFTTKKEALEWLHSEGYTG